MHALVRILHIHVHALTLSLIWYIKLGVCAHRRLLQPSSIKNICDAPVRNTCLSKDSFYCYKGIATYLVTISQSQMVLLVELKGLSQCLVISLQATCI